MMAQQLGWCGKKGRHSPERAEGEEFLSQPPVSYVQQKLQSSREKRVGNIVQAVVRLLGFGK